MKKNNSIDSIKEPYASLRIYKNKITKFKKNIIEFYDNLDENRREKYHEQIITTFFNKTYYSEKYHIGSKGDIDIVIHNEKSPNSKVGVLFEVKRPLNKSEMPTKENLNSKALQELIYYFLKENISYKNDSIHHLIITNGYEWFILDAKLFRKILKGNKKIIKKFNEFESGNTTGSGTDHFYNHIASPFIETDQDKIPFIHFDLRNFEDKIRDNSIDDGEIVWLYKIFSPEYLLKLQVDNDSNTLNKKFYAELLHIIGLEETKVKGKKVIGRKEKNRNAGSIIENTITILKYENRLSQIETLDYGENEDKQLFNVALELVITWINRILFLKLLEGQLITYHPDEKIKDAYKFLNYKTVPEYDELNKLFFQVLAIKQNDRSENVKKKYNNVPYLNSSLFEPNELEYKTIFVSNLEDDSKIPYYKSTIVKDNGKRKNGDVTTLEYLLLFLGSYDFGSVKNQKIKKDNIELINASVLGLIFEKINGYKDGSFFTPGFITEYMSRETIRKAVVQKFKDKYGWEVSSIEDLKNYLIDKRSTKHIIEFNELVNTLRVCDPAVGSGHFLVSVLNEILSIKFELGILANKNGVRIEDVTLEVLNDNLTITEKGDYFRYDPNDNRSIAIQKTLFHEKQTIIENCLFGVDINPNSVKICRLRLWIELLKNAYYKEGTQGLETLPNIDINIKCGNSLISRFPLDISIEKAIKKSELNVSEYRDAIMSYRNAKNKEEKRKYEIRIEEIKTAFEKSVEENEKLRKKLEHAKAKLSKVLDQQQWFQSKVELTKQKKNVENLTKDIKNLEITIDEEKNNQIYKNAFEWRFEFPEVLDDNGNFVGFDVVIGNPPYVYRNTEIINQKNYYRKVYYNTSGNFDLYKFFIELGIRLNKENGLSSLITNSSFLLQMSFKRTREFLISNTSIETLIPLGGNVFDEATVDSAIYTTKKTESKKKTKIVVPNKPLEINETRPYFINSLRFITNEYLVFDYLLHDYEYKIVNRLITEFPKIESGFEFGVGINTGYIKSELTSESRIDGRYHPLVLGTGVSKYGNVNTSGYIMYDKEFVKSRGKLGRSLPDEKFFTEPKILIVRTRNISIKERIVATIDYEKKYNLNRISNIIAKPEYSLEGLLGIINSKLFNWLYSKRYFDYEIKPIYLRNSPLADTNNKELNTKVKKLLASKTGYDNLSKSKLITDIDNIVFELYGITNDELKIVEESMNN